MAFLNRNFSGLSGVTEDQTAIATSLYKWWDDHIPYNPPLKPNLPLAKASGYTSILPMYALEVALSYNVDRYVPQIGWFGYVAIDPWGQYLKWSAEDSTWYPLDPNNEGRVIKAFGELYKDYIDAYIATLTDIATHGEILREFIWRKDPTTKIKLQMIDAVVVGDIERVRATEQKMNNLLSPQTNFSALQGSPPAWTFNPSLLEVYTPPVPVYAPPATVAPATYTINLSQIATVEQAQLQFEQAQSQGAPPEVLNAISNRAAEIIQQPESIQAEAQDIVDTEVQDIVSYQSQVSLAGFPWWGWLVLGGVGLAVIKRKKSKMKGRPYGRRT